MESKLIKYAKDFNLMVNAVVDNNPAAVATNLGYLGYVSTSNEQSKQAIKGMAKNGLFDYVYYALNVPYLKSEDVNAKLFGDLFNSVNNVVNQLSQTVQVGIQTAGNIYPSLINATGALIGTTLQGASPLVGQGAQIVAQNPGLIGALTGNPLLGLGELFGGTKGPETTEQKNNKNSLFLFGGLAILLVLIFVLFFVFKK